MIPRIDRLILKDVFGPWLFGVGLFASLLMAATYLGRIAGFIVDGVPPVVVLELTGLLFPPILTKTFTMSVLLASLLGFSRLSSDSELVALRAAGASVYRIILPVLGFSTAMCLATFAFNEKFVPIATTAYQAIIVDMTKHIKIKDPMPALYPVVQNKKLQLAVIAENVNVPSQTLRGVIIHSYGDNGEPGFEMRADVLQFRENALDALLNPNGALEKLAFDWKASGNVLLISPKLDSVIHVSDGVWPSQVHKIDQSFAQISEPKDADFDRYTMAQLREFIITHRNRGDMTEKNLHNYEYGYWGKVAVPLAAIMFGVLGAVLGIRSHRSGTASGYGIAIGITFLFVLLGNIMSIWAQGGVIPAWVAAFTPIMLGSVASVVIMWLRNG